MLDCLDLPHDAASESFHAAECRGSTVSRSQVEDLVNARGIGRRHVYERALAPLIAASRENGSLQAEQPALPRS